jgi:hypothetical protein
VFGGAFATKNPTRMALGLNLGLLSEKFVTAVLWHKQVALLHSLYYFWKYLYDIKQAMDYITYEELNQNIVDVGSLGKE